MVEQATAVLCDKRVAVLGELPSHGEGRAFAIKAQIARRLVEQCGFERVLFEAPAYDFFGVENALSKGTATARQLDKAIGRFWWASELAEWRGWLFEQAKRGKLQLGGVDDQVSATSEYARATLPGLVASRLPAKRAEVCRAAVTRHLEWSYDGAHPLDEAEQKRLVDCTREAATSHEAQSHVPIAGETAISLENFAGYIARQFKRGNAPERDEAMFRNTIRDGRHPKTIVWTATVHAAKRQGGRPYKPMGQWLWERWGDEVGSVGFTALGGKTSMAGKPPVALPPAPEGSLEARALVPGQDEVFVDNAALASFGVVESRLYGKLIPADWAASFDGVVVIREEVPPTFEASR